MSLDFVPASNQRIETGTPDVPANTGALTVMAWIINRSTVGNHRIISKADGTNPNDHIWMLSNNSDSTLRSRIRAGGTTTTVSGGSALPNNVWIHVAVTYDGTTQRNFVDAVLEASAANSGDVDIDGALENWIGNQPPDGTAMEANRWDGDIADVRIYTRALPVSELEHVFRSFGGDGITTGLLFWWRLQEFHAGLVATIAGSVKQIGPGNAGRFDGTPVNSPVYANDVIRWRGPYNH